MFKLEELKSNALLGELNDEQLNEIIAITQSKGDVIAKTKNDALQQVETLKAENESLKNELTTKKQEEVVNVPEPNSEDDKSKIEQSLLSTVEELKLELASIKEEKTKTDLRKTLLQNAEDSDFDLVKTTSIIDKIYEDTGSYPKSLDGFEAFIGKETKTQSSEDNLPNGNSGVPSEEDYSSILKEAGFISEGE